MRRKLPGYTPTRDNQVENGILFLKQWIGDHAQESGDGNLYWPINLSLLFVYNNLYWPWWKDQQNDWTDEPNDCGTRAENELMTALAVLPEEQVLLYVAQRAKNNAAPRYITSGLQQPNVTPVEDKKEEPSVAQEDGGGDLQAWLHQMSEQGDQDAPERLADAMGEEEATKTSQMPSA